ncbi:hypothetical protein NOR_07991 [Metarhizium rileyi]|uniref:Uncharacterized protein n=1 Tax=Metarhizium rileyi (strain RCEF 4871) TaxID=1649241 RepID=A0A166X476_METRR|nr:hypothetical protein NOR_07991 [Metarhizium rileyi RCEF 4871]
MKSFASALGVAMLLGGHMASAAPREPVAPELKPTDDAKIQDVSKDVAPAQGGQQAYHNPCFNTNNVVSTSGTSARYPCSEVLWTERVDCGPKANTPEDFKKQQKCICGTKESPSNLRYDYSACHKCMKQNGLAGAQESDWNDQWLAKLIQSYCDADPSSLDKDYFEYTQNATDQMKKTVGEKPLDQTLSTISIRSESNEYYPEDFVPAPKNNATTNPGRSVRTDESDGAANHFSLPCVVFAKPEGEGNANASSPSGSPAIDGKVPSLTDDTKTNSTVGRNSTLLTPTLSSRQNKPAEANDTCSGCKPYIVFVIVLCRPDVSQNKTGINFERNGIDAQRPVEKVPEDKVDKVSTLPDASHVKNCQDAVSKVEGTPVEIIEKKDVIPDNGPALPAAAEPGSNGSPGTASPGSNGSPGTASPGSNGSPGTPDEDDECDIDFENEDLPGQPGSPGSGSPGQPGSPGSPGSAVEKDVPGSPGSNPSEGHVCKFCEEANSGKPTAGSSSVCMTCIVIENKVDACGKKEQTQKECEKLPKAERSACLCKGSFFADAMECAKSQPQCGEALVKSYTETKDLLCN